MILNHSYEFIFVKTVKTAGTSVEIALSKMCCKSDIVTPISPEDEKTRRQLGFQGPINYRYSPREVLGNVDKEKLKSFSRGQWPNKYSNHIPLHEIKKLVLPGIWEKYTKITIVRNPYDRAISLYWWFLSQNNFSPSNYPFLRFLRSQASSVYGNWEKYTIEDELLVDKVVFYEDLSNGLNDLSVDLGCSEWLGEQIGSIKAKSGIRDQTGGKFELLTEEAVDLISVLCRLEIEAFGYSCLT